MSLHDMASTINAMLKKVSLATFVQAISFNMHDAFRETFKFCSKEKT